MRPISFIEPRLPTLWPSPPTTDAVCHECKFDGHRLQIHKHGRGVRLFTRNGHDYSKRFTGIASVVAGFRARQVILDGELVARRRMTGRIFTG
jgi:bifunctional non-homologous end joining protein LigD